MTTNLCILPATELAQKLRQKELSAREVFSAHLVQIERVNPDVNAMMQSRRNYVCEGTFAKEAGTQI